MNVYFVIAHKPSSRLLKIGKARNVKKRMMSLQAGCPYPLSLMATIQCTSDKHAFAVERAAHEVFKKKRTRSGGEWFRLTKQVESECRRFCEIAQAKRSACLLGGVQ